jgi:hypothetical protein
MMQRWLSILGEVRLGKSRAWRGREESRMERAGMRCEPHLYFMAEEQPRNAPHRR